MLSSGWYLIFSYVETNASEETLRSIIDSDDWINMFYPNVSNHPSDYMVWQPRRTKYKYKDNLKTQNFQAVWKSQFGWLQFSILLSHLAFSEIICKMS
jgi:hypothetical protein